MNNYLGRYSDEQIWWPCFTFGNQATCTYCGDVATSIDHVIPVAWQVSVDRSKTPDLSGRLGPRTWACRRCNSTLNDGYFEDFWARCQYAHDSIERRTKPIIWSGYELARLDYGLKEHVKHKISIRKWMRFRADWFESRDFLLNIENLTWVDFLLVGTKRLHKPCRAYFRSTLERLSILVTGGDALPSFGGGLKRRSDDSDAEKGYLKEESRPYRTGEGEEEIWVSP